MGDEIMMQPFAFISYRRDDSRDWANLLADLIQRHFGRTTVFLDTDSLRAGDTWSALIDDALNRATVLLPVIGPKWLFLQNPDDGRRRLDGENDWVRREIEHAISAGQEIVPVIVGGASIPAEGALPESIRSLHFRQAIRVNDKRDIAAVITHLEERCGFRRLKTELDFPTPVDRSSQLTEKELAEALTHLPGWMVLQRESERGTEGMAFELVYTFKFNSFEDAIHFMASAARYISRTDHHPNWEHQYKDLRVRLTTWDVGLRITSKDVRLADYLQWLYREYAVGESPWDGSRSRYRKREGIEPNGAG